MITIQRIEELAQQALELPVGCGNQHLACLQESWAPYLRFMYLCIKTFDVKFALELGVNKGTCTGHMAYGSSLCSIFGIDIEPNMDALYMQKEFPNIKALYRGYTTDPIAVYMIENDVREFGEIGLIFLDSTHDGDTPRQEFEVYKHLFADECIVVVDDLLGPRHQMEKMQEFWQWLPGEKVELHYLHPVPDTHIGIIDQPGFGVSIVRKA